MADTVVWSIIDGNLPYLDEFPDREEIEYTSDVLWRISNGDLPYKKAFPERIGITDVSDIVWIIEDEALPYKRCFPEMPKRPRRVKPYNKHICPAIVLSDYKQQIKFNENYEQTIIIPTYKVTVITEEW